MTISQDRWLRILAALGARAGAEPGAEAMCSAAADLLGAAGAGILVMADGVPGATFASSPLAASLEDLQFTLGAGPRVDAFAGGIPVAEVDLDAASAHRWFGFCGPALDAGIGSVLSFPLRLGAARLGALTVYRAEPGPLDGDLYADALVLAEVVTRALLAAQAGVADGALAAGLRDGGTFDARVHQASGMVSAQLKVSVGEGLARLRARAFADGTALGHVAAEVIARRLRFEGR